ncbi:hypothetical protein POVCU2_0033780 [Plasmodium ovale curtisi]|uniref:Kinetochore protein SPC25 n=1 Tax=Plasmodium ovale curtisi TaxID=864141 RepID=A0A1A8VZ05_PLAOA|nr:hypothetical protein POVCU2_0033780 [Plasmodium ovale curtisi]SBS96127.1 hypothetical protein POVCU1_030910 [Plasmodium ovale curtisi]
MENTLDNGEIKKTLQLQINHIVEDNEKQYNDIISYIENEKRQIEIIKNKTKEKKMSINRITHEIEANTVLVTELKESVLEEEKKLDEYPKLIDEINDKLNMIFKNLDASKLAEYKTVKLHKDYIENEWKRKLETLYNLLGFEMILEDGKIIIEFSNIQASDPQKRYRAVVALHNGIYEAIQTIPRINKFEDYVNSMNREKFLSDNICENDMYIFTVDRNVICFKQYSKLKGNVGEFRNACPPLRIPSLFFSIQKLKNINNTMAVISFGCLAHMKKGSSKCSVVL